MLDTSLQFSLSVAKIKLAAAKVWTPSYDLTLASRALISSKSSSSLTPSAIASSCITNVTCSASFKARKQWLKCNCITVRSHIPPVHRLMAKQVVSHSPSWQLLEAVQQFHQLWWSKPYQPLILFPLLYPPSLVLCPQHHSQSPR